MKTSIYKELFSYFWGPHHHCWGVLGDSVVKHIPANAGDVGSIPGLGISPGMGNGNPFQYSCLENSMDRRTWWATVHGVTESSTRLSAQPVGHPTFSFSSQLCSKGDQPWDFFGRNDAKAETPVLWPPHVKS